MSKVSFKEKPQDQEKITFSGKYFYGTGRRKNAVARVRIYTEGKKKGILINEKEHKQYFPTLELSRIIEDPLRVTGNKSKFTISIKVCGGGQKGQAEACRHGIARALIVLDENYKSQLRDSGFLTRDPRVKERKKPGLKKARRAPQWQKR